MHPGAAIRLALSDIIKTSFVIVHSRSPFVAAIHHQFKGNKKPCFHSGSRVGRKLLLVKTLPACPVSDWESAHNGTGLPIGLGRIHSRGWRDHDVSRLAQPASSSSSGLICSCSFSSNVRDVYHAYVVTVHLYFRGMMYLQFEYSHCLMGRISRVQRQFRSRRDGRTDQSSS